MIVAAAGAAAPRIGVLTDNYPYSFRDENGRMSGFAYELAVEIEQTMGLKFDRVEGTTAEINGAFAAGRLDVLQSYADFPERKRQAAFSVPYLTMSGAIIVRRGESGIRSFADLRGHRVLVHRGSMGEALLRHAGLGDSVVHADSVEQALIRIDRGDGDATLVTRLSGLSEAHRLGLNHLRALDVPVEGYDVRYCFAVRPDDHELLAQINEGLATLVRTGRFAKLYQKWFGQVERPGYSAEQVILAVAVGLALALAVTTWAMVRQRSLHRRISEQASDLRSSEERYRELFEGSRDGLILLDLDGSEPAVAQINPAACRILGVASQQAAAGATLAALLPGDPSLAARIRSSTGAGRSGEFEHNRGDTGWVRVVVSPLGPRSLVSVADISESARVHEQLRLQEEQLRQKQKLEAIGTLAGGVAHDFNNLLTAILGNAELALLGLPRDGEEAAEIQQVVTAGKRARDLVRQILTFSRRSEPRRESLALGPFVRETIDLLRMLAKGSVDFEVNLPGDLPPVLADPAQIHQVLMNIGTNAVQAMRGARGRLSFQADTLRTGEELQEQHAQLRPGFYIRLGIQDTGPGMTPEVQRRIFEPFFTTKAPGEGTGLGLSVVHGIMEQHGGTVTLYSQPGRGTLFHLYFPVSEATGADASSASPGQLTGRGERILLVDDDPAIVETARKILAQLRYAVTTHTRADAAWTEWSAAPDAFTLIVSDLTMPGMNGLQFLARVRTTRPAQPFLLVSGFFSDAEAAEANARSVSGLIPKPLSYAALGRAVSETLRAHGRERPVA